MYEERTYGSKKIISQEEKRALAEAVDVIMDDLNLFHAGALSGGQLFLRWQEQGNRMAATLGLPPPEWLPLPSILLELPATDEEKMKA